MMFWYRAIYKKAYLTWSGGLCRLVFARLVSLHCQVVIYFIAAIEHKNQRKLLKTCLICYRYSDYARPRRFILCINMHTHFINNAPLAKYSQ